MVKVWWRYGGDVQRGHGDVLALRGAAGCRGGCCQARWDVQGEAGAL